MPSEKIACRFLTFNYNSTLVINKILSYEKKSLKNDGQQFHQYQQNLSPSLTQKDQDL